MTDFASFLDVLLHKGKAVLVGPPSFPVGWEEDVLPLLKNAYEIRLLELPGTPVPFDGTAALQAAKVVWYACWFLVSQTETSEVLERTLVLPRPPQSTAEHFAADLTLRFLPQIYQRARARDPADSLTQCLATLLRTWPLSGALSQIEEPPLTALDFAGHAGLRLLYAERLARHRRPAWHPSRATSEYVEFVDSLQ